MVCKTSLQLKLKHRLQHSSGKREHHEIKTCCKEKKWSIYQVFFKENVRYPVWTCRDPISLNLGTRILWF